MNLMEELLPKPPEWKLPWNVALKILGHLAEEMRNTQQNLQWHGEGNVLNHTQMVCEALVGMEEYRRESPRVQLILLVAALLHDIGKIQVTVCEDGQWTSRGHAKVGARMARCMLWQEWGYSGTVDLQDIRETICNLIRYHGTPPYVYEKEDGILRWMRIAANEKLTPSFSIRLLCMLSKADVCGRLCEDREELLENIELGAELAKEASVYEHAYPYPTDYTQHAHLCGRGVSPDYTLYDDTWGEVILMSGLPGTGKDTWIRNHYQGLPVVSLDDIRKELRISPVGPQFRVIEKAKERAKEYLRKKQPFVWNATNITDQIRKQQIDLFTAYGAAVRIVYLETEWLEELRRNEERKGRVPEGAIANMMKKMTLPERYEAHYVEWHCV